MTLHAIVAALGGDLYGGGMRANTPAPGHSASDRSVSLLLSGDRLVVHSFGSTPWAVVRDHLRAAGLIDREGRLTGPGGGPGDTRAQGPRPDVFTRVATARRLWREAGPVSPASLSRRHLMLRAVRTGPASLCSLRHHPAAPLSAYHAGGRRRPALLAAITSPQGDLTAVEMTYLAPNGARDQRLRLPRKTVGVVPPGSAVRLAPSAPVMVAGEGVMSVLSASERWALPGWALLSANNLAGWTPPPAVRRVIIAADRGAPGELAAARLLDRLRAGGIAGVAAPPPDGAEDWNAWAVWRRRKEGG